MEQKQHHCQICERDIKLVFLKHEVDGTIGRHWVIAHHGYQRPHGEGWQSPSCFGAKFRPYEVACDALPIAIENITAYIEGQKKRYKDFTTNPPAELSRNAGSMWRPNWVKLPRPEGFDFKTNEADDHYRHGTYEQEHKGTCKIIRRNIEDAQRNLTRFKKRLADWKPTV